MRSPKETIDAYFAAIRAKDAEAWLACFAIDAVAYDPADGPARQGIAAHRQFFEDVARLFSKLDFHPGQAHVCGMRAAVPFTARCVANNGNTAEATGIDVFVFDSDGRIQTAHGYWDPTPLFLAAGVGAGR